MLQCSISAIFKRKWESDEQYFVKTRATKEAEKLIATETCLVVTGSSGCGKSILVQHLALDLIRKGYNLSIAKGPSDVVYTDQNQVFVFEDPFGNNSFMTNEVLCWERELQNIRLVLQLSDENDDHGKVINQQCSKHNIVIISCRLNIYKNKQLKQIKQQLRMKECNICSRTLCLTPDEQREIFNRYVKADVNYDQIENEYEYFPLICKLSKNEKDPKIVKHIFENPPKHIQHEIENMKRRNKNYFFLFCLCVMFDNGFRKSWLQNWSIEGESKIEYTEFKRITKIMSNQVYNTPRLESELARLEIIEALEELEGSYFKLLGDDIVLLVHDKIYDIAAKACGQSLFLTFLENASPNFITERYTFSPQGSDLSTKSDFLITVDTRNAKEFFCQVVKKILSYSILITDVSLLKCEIAQTYFVNYIIQTNQLKSVESAGQSPLCLAVDSKYINVVRLLLNQNAITSICTGI